MNGIKHEIDKIAKKYSKPFYVRADEKDLTLWGLRIRSTLSTIALYKKQNKMLITIDKKKTWFTTDVYKNHRAILEEAVHNYEKLLKYYVPKDKNNS